MKIIDCIEDARIKFRESEGREPTEITVPRADYERICSELKEASITTYDLTITQWDAGFINMR